MVRKAHPVDLTMNRDSFIFRLAEKYGNGRDHRGKWWIHSKLRKLLRLSIDEDMDVFRQGLTWRLNPADYVQSQLFWLGEMDRWYLHHVMKRIAEGSVVLDIGANFGFYTLMLASKMKCRVHAFEPVSSTFERLSHHVKVNHLDKRVVLHRMALGDCEGTVSMSTRPGNSGEAQISTTGDDTPMSSLDHLLTCGRIEAPAFLKIDVEGFEPMLLRGAYQLIFKCRPLMLIELNPRALREMGSSAEDLLSILEGHRYELTTFRRDSLEPFLEVPTQGYMNLLCLPG